MPKCLGKGAFRFPYLSRTAMKRKRQEDLPSTLLLKRAPHNSTYQTSSLDFSLTLGGLQRVAMLRCGKCLDGAKI